MLAVDHQCAGLRRRCRLAISWPLPRLARTPTGATGCLVHHLGILYEFRYNPPAGHATGVERTSGVGVRHRAARLARPRGSRPDPTTLRRRRADHFGVATSHRQPTPRRAHGYSHAHGIGESAPGTPVSITFRSSSGRSASTKLKFDRVMNVKASRANDLNLVSNKTSHPAD